jgi:hypothetical protein
MTTCYSELSKIPDFFERFKLLKSAFETSAIGEITFGGLRHLNQDFYKSNEWKSVRNEVILRDSGCDLGVLTRPIRGRLHVHHMNPIVPSKVNWKDLTILLDPEYLILVSVSTHNALHYGGVPTLYPEYVPRTQGDTLLWREF